MTSSSRSLRQPVGGHGESLRDMLSSILADGIRSRRVRGLPDIAVTIDVPVGHAIPAAPLPFRRLLESLVRRALESAARSAEDSEAPAIRELLVTSVDVGDAIEIEVADSGPALSRAVTSWIASDGDEVPEGAGLALVAARAAAARIGGTLRVINCPEGGVAITLRMPHRQARRLAA